MPNITKGQNSDDRKSELDYILNTVPPRIKTWMIREMCSRMGITYAQLWNLSKKPIDSDFSFNKAKIILEVANRSNYFHFTKVEDIVHYVPTTHESTQSKFQLA
jgi:hypothetical protein